MKKLLLSSAILLLFSASIIIFQISCKKDATAQATNCLDMATIICTINFPSGVIPRTVPSDNGIWVTGNQKNPNLSYFFDFTNVGTASQKVYTFENVYPGQYKLSAQIARTVTVPPQYYLIWTDIYTLDVVAGQTYTMTINGTDFHN